MRPLYRGRLGVDRRRIVHDSPNDPGRCAPRTAGRTLPTVYQQRISGSTTSGDNMKVDLAQWLWQRGHTVSHRHERGTIPIPIGVSRAQPRELSGGPSEERKKNSTEDKYAKIDQD